MKYGLQVYTVRNEIAKDFETTFEAIKSIGYEYVELPSLYGKTSAEFKAFLDKIDLQSSSIMFLPSQLENEVDEIISTCKILNCRFAICVLIRPEFRTVTGFLHHAEILETAAVKLKVAGITLAYHNHAFEFDKLEDGSCGYDILLDNTKTLCFEPDVYWFAVAEREPLEIMRKLEGRMPLLHLKDMTADEDKAPCEIGHGILPLKEIVAHANRSGVEFAFVEQDKNWVVSPIESARESLNALRKNYRHS